MSISVFPTGLLGRLNEIKHSGSRPVTAFLWVLHICYCIESHPNFTEVDSSRQEKEVQRDEVT